MKNKSQVNIVACQEKIIDADVVIFVVPMSLEGDRYSIPSLWVNVTQTVSTDLDNTLGHDVGLLVEMDVVLVWVVEATHGSDSNWCGKLLETLWSRHLLECLQHHFF